MVWKKLVFEILIMQEVVSELIFTRDFRSIKRVRGDYQVKFGWFYQTEDLCFMQIVTRVSVCFKLSVICVTVWNSNCYTLLTINIALITDLVTLPITSVFGFLTLNHFFK